MAAADNDTSKRPTFYLVQREGVYGRGIVGIFTTDAKAEEAARAAAAEEDDNHHDFVCYVVQSNMRVTLAYASRQRDAYEWVLQRHGLPGGGYEITLQRPGADSDDLHSQ